MPLKIEQLKAFLGFGVGTKRGEYFFSDGFQKTPEGISPTWEIRSGIDSGTLITLLNSTAFGQIDDGAGNYYIYQINRTTAASNGKIHRTVRGADVWSCQNTTTVTSYGNGLITDQKGRLLYLQTRYMGMMDPSTWVWNDVWKDFSVNISPVDAFRPATLYANWVVIGNQDKVALLGTITDSWNTSAFTFPTGFLIRALSANRTGILMGANIGPKGVLVLWDGESLTAIAPWIWLDDNISAIIPYGDWWIVAAGTRFLITNGYNYKELPRPPDSKMTEYTYTSVYPNGMIVKDNYLLVGGGELGWARKKVGLWILDLINGVWNFCHIYNKCLKGVTMGAIFSDNAGDVYLGNSTTTPATYYLGRFWNIFAGGTTTSDSIYTYISPKIGQGDSEKIAEGIKLNLGLYHETQMAFVTPNPNFTMSIKIYDFKRRLFNYMTTNALAGANNQIRVDGSARSTLKWQVEIGDEVIVLQGVNAGEIRHISNITNKGLVNETWTVDSAFPGATENSISVEICPFIKVGSQAINTYKIKDYYFKVGHSPKSKKFLVKIVLDCPIGVSGVIQPEITGLSLIYNDLGLF